MPRASYNKESAITELRIHVGAHKTGTTHLQSTLEAAAHQIELSGATYLPLEVVRDYFSKFPYTKWGYRFARYIPSSRSFLLRPQTLNLLEAFERQSSSRGPLIFSEEDLLGNTQCLTECQFYPHLAKIHLIHDLSRFIPTRIFLTIRSFDEYLPSAYAENLKGRKLSRKSFEKSAIFFSQRSKLWHGLIKRISHIAPNAAIEVWLHGDYRSNWRFFHQRLIGNTIGDMPELEIPNRTRTPSELAISAAEKLDIIEPKARHREVRIIFEDDLKYQERPKFDPFSRSEKEVFKSIFADDIKSIERSFPGAITRPAGEVPTHGKR